MTNSSAGVPAAGRREQSLIPTVVRRYHIFLASPGDVQDERQAVRNFVERFNRNYARFRGIQFEVIDWEHYSSTGIGRPQELITRQTLETFRPSLALVIGIMAQRFGSPSGTHESGTEEEFEYAVQSWRTRGFPEIKWYFRQVERLSVDADPQKAHAELEQWGKVRDFRARMSAMEPRLYTRTYRDLPAFVDLLEQDLGQWLNAPERPWMTPEPDPRSAVSGDDHRHQAHHLYTPPAKPEPFTAHAYSLLQTSSVVGRSDEIAHLSKWFGSGVSDASLLFVVAMGGMGKSAATWRWYVDTIGGGNDTSDGAMWWSFYESDAGYERFVTQCCAYVSGTPAPVVLDLDFSEREDLLLSCLQQGRFLVVLDGAERLLRAYATLGASYVHDDNLDQQTAHALASGESVSERNAADFNRRRRLREFTDHRAARLFTRLLGIRNSRVLVSSRLFPSNLENVLAQPLPGCKVRFLHGLTDRDALDLWHEFGGTGSTTDLSTVFRQLGNYPLAIRALAGTVARFRPAPGDFTEWRKANPEFLTSDVNLRRSTRQVLKYAFQDLDDAELTVLRILAAFRMPVGWPVLIDVVRRLPPSLFGRPEDDAQFEYAAATLTENTLESLEDRGLMGWDRSNNRYDLHPVVRLSTWNSTPDEHRTAIQGAVGDHYSVQLADEADGRTSGEISTQIEYFYVLTALGRYDDAFTFFTRELYEQTLHSESFVRVHLELLEQFFPNGLQEAPAFQLISRRERLHRWLAYAHLMVGEPGTAAEITVGSLRPHWMSAAEPNWRELYFALAECGRLREAEAALALVYLDQSRHQDVISAQLSALPWLTRELSIRGQNDHADGCAARLIEVGGRLDGDQAAVWAGVQARRLSRDRLLAANRLLDRGDIAGAVEMLDLVERTVDNLDRIREKMRFLELRGEAYRLTGQVRESRTLLEQALLLSRSHGVVGIEMPCLIGLARLAFDTGREEEASDYLRDVEEPAARGPYPTIEADASVVAAELALRAGNVDLAVREASSAYAKAWCDGPPYAYAKGLSGARSVLDRCGAELPWLKPFDPDRFANLPGFSISVAGRFDIEAFRPATSSAFGALESFIEIGRSLTTRTPPPITGFR